MEVLSVPRVAHRFVEVDGVRVFYREAGPRNAPTMLLLHGFPSASHQFRRLIDVLGGRYRLIARTTPASGTPARPGRPRPAGRSPTPSTGLPTSSRGRGAKPGRAGALWA